MLSILLLALPSSPAQAGTTVVYGSGDPATALARVLAADPDAKDLEARQLSDLLKGASASMTGGTLKACEGNPTTLEELHALEEQIEGMVGYMEFENALASLGHATASLACLRDRMDEEVAPRLYFLEGIAAHGSGDEDRARRAFATALVFDPELVWDDYFPPDAKPLLDEARSQRDPEARASLKIYPTPGAGALWIDGRVADDLNPVPGDHVVQVLAGRMRTFLVSLPAGTENVLTIPDALDNERADWVEDDSVRFDVSMVLTSHLEADSLYFSTPDGVWKITVGDWPWESLEITGELVTSANLPTPAASPKFSKAATMGGAVVFGSGAALAGASFFKGRQVETKAHYTTDWTTYYELEDQYRDWQSRLVIGEAVAVAGLLLVGTGYGLDGLSDTGVAPWFGPEGGGLLLVGQR
jgi:hypothetical protein